MRRHWLLAAVAAALAAIAAVVFFDGEAASERHPAPTDVRTVTVRNACHHTVWLFYGRNAPVRPEDAVTLGGGESSAESMLEGDLVWLLADDKAVVDSAAVGPRTTSVVVADTCSAIAAVDGD